MPRPPPPLPQAPRGAKAATVHVVSALDRTQLALELGAVGYLRKPATHELLTRAIRDLEGRARREGQRLLIVEDDATLRANLQTLLARDGLEIVAVGTADAARQALKAAAFRTDDPKSVIAKALTLGEAVAAQGIKALMPA